MKSRISLGPTIKQQDKAMARLKKTKGQNGPNSFEPAPPNFQKIAWVDALKASDDIDRSVRELPYLYYEVCDAYADAVNAQRRLKDRYDQTYTATELDVWKTGEKITVAKTKAYVEADVGVKKAAKLLRHATEAVTKLEAVKLAFQQKASMLKAEVELVASQFIQRDHVKPKTRRTDKWPYIESTTRSQK